MTLRERAEAVANKTLADAQRGAETSLSCGDYLMTYQLIADVIEREAKSFAERVELLRLHREAVSTGYQHTAEEMRPYVETTIAEAIAAAEGETK